jgi:hypothetical protein
MLARASVSAILLTVTAALVAWSFGLNGLVAATQNLSLLALSTVFAALLANALAAALRFKVIAADVGHSIGYRRAIAAVSVGSLGGAAFFQLAGQLMARGAMMKQAGIPFASVVVMTLYERAIAAVISGLLALAGAYFLFGRIVFDQQSGGGAFIKIVVGLLVATLAGALLGYGRRAAQVIAPRLTGNFASRLLRAVALSLIVQLPMMVAYTAISHALSPSTPIAQLAAASTIVMFAASVPISLAGWGIREMSAVFALSAIGVGTGDALVAAVTIGAGSLVTMIVLAAISITSWHKSTRSPSIEKKPEQVDYLTFLCWSLPLAAATLVLFQLYIPISSGTLLNVNLADPVVILGGSLFVLQAVNTGRVPTWRLPNLNAALIAMTAILTFSLIAGATRIGYTEWAVVNRFLGWFVLLAYAATGALIVRAGGKDAFRLILLTYVGATSAVAGIEIILKLLFGAGVHLPPGLSLYGDALGFAQNHNFFAFQLLMALGAAMVVLCGSRIRTIIFTLLLAALWFAGSRSGWIAAAVLLTVSLHLKIISAREIATAMTGVLLLAVFRVVLPFLHHDTLVDVHQHMSRLARSIRPPDTRGSIPDLIPNGASTQERLITLIGGWRMFLEHPLFGAGLGAFRNLHILSHSKIPLLIHSTALWLMAELGIVGLIAFVAPALSVLVAEFRRKERDDASLLLILCLVAFAVMSTPADMLYQRTFWILVGAGLAMPIRSTSCRSTPSNLTSF